MEPGRELSDVMGPGPVPQVVGIGNEVTKPAAYSEVKVVLGMVALPARGKSYLRDKLISYLKWLDYDVKVFSIDSEQEGPSVVTHKPAQAPQEDQLDDKLEGLVRWLKDGGNVGIHDAPNYTKRRRAKIEARIAKEPGIVLVFLESLCDDPALVAANVALRLSIGDPRYQHMSMDEAEHSFLRYIRECEAIYETITEPHLSYLRVTNMGQKFTLSRMNGFLEARIAFYLMNLHKRPRSIFLSRHGESEFNLEGKIGGDSLLSPRGIQYATYLPTMMLDNIGDIPLTVWTSTQQSTIQTAQWLPYSKFAWKSLDELDAGVCDGMTYDEIELAYPDDFANRDMNKFNYRYRAGESYRDVIGRLEPVVMELERQENVLIIGHQAVIRCIYSYFRNLSQEDLPYTNIPLHTLIKLTPTGSGCDEERYTLPIAAVDTHRPRPSEISEPRGAAFDSPERDSAPQPECLPGTCEDVIEKVFDWIEQPDERRMFWLSGLAGTGKSALAQTIARRCAKDGLLLASFFFSRDSRGRNRAAQFFPAISYQLSLRSTTDRSTIVIPNGDPLRDPLEVQLQQLIVAPLLRSAKPEDFPKVVVVDALDECADHYAIVDIIQLLADELDKTKLPLRFFFTSRPEPRIREKFATVEPMTRALNLLEFDAEANIRVFLRSGFAEIFEKRDAVMHSVPKPWPSDHDLDRLVKQSSGLFIFASTLLKFVGSNIHDPKQQLHMILNVEHDSEPFTFDAVNRLYRQIISACPRTVHTEMVIGTIILAFDPISLQDIEGLLGLQNGEARLAVKGMHSLLASVSEPDKPVRILHASLRQFLLDRRRAGAYFIDPLIRHENLARSCLECIFNLRRDVGNTEDPITRRIDIQHSQRERKNLIDGSLRYACRYWATHLSLLPLKMDVLDELSKFGFNYLLYWIEALSITGNLQSAIPSLKQAKKWLGIVMDSSTGLLKAQVELIELFEQAEKFIDDFFYPISINPLHIYYTALPGTPRRSLFFRSHRHQLVDTEEKLSTLLKRTQTALRGKSLFGTMPSDRTQGNDLPVVESASSHAPTKMRSMKQERKGKKRK